VIPVVVLLHLLIISFTVLLVEVFGICSFLVVEFFVLATLLDKVRVSLLSY